MREERVVRCSPSHRNSYCLRGMVRKKQKPLQMRTCRVRAGHLLGMRTGSRVSAILVYTFSRSSRIDSNPLVVWFLDWHIMYLLGATRSRVPEDASVVGFSGSLRFHRRLLEW